MRHKLWFRIFWRVAAAFAVFLVVLTVSNVAFLTPFFTLSEKRTLKEQAEIICCIPLDNGDKMVNTISDIGEKYHIEVEIFDYSDKIRFTSYSAQMLDYYYYGNSQFKMRHKTLETDKSEKTKNGIFETACDTYTGSEYLIFRTEVEDGVFAELRLQTALIESSARTANKFITAVAVLCLLGALVWTLAFTKKFSSPITEMSEITKDMAALKFDRKVKNTSRDEIGELGVSINELSEKLSASLNDLREKNERLSGEIERERQLDVMRKVFVADVSHELKTPISIIQGYAEGLKLNVNPLSKDEYIDTIITESDRMNSLVLSILELSRYESGQIPLNPENFSLSALACEMASKMFAKDDVSLVLPQEEITVFADKSTVEQILKVYLENARSHINENGTLEVKIIADSSVRTEIHNTGSFVEKDKMANIWQSFYRGDSSHKRDENRFGLGLSIVSAICRQNGWLCGVKNTASGVCFWFEIKAD